MTRIFYNACKTSSSFVNSLTENSLHGQCNAISCSDESLGLSALYQHYLMSIQSTLQPRLTNLYDNYLSLCLRPSVIWYYRWYSESNNILKHHFIQYIREVIWRSNSNYWSIGKIGQSETCIVLFWLTSMLNFMAMYWDDCVDNDRSPFSVSYSLPC